MGTRSVNHSITRQDRAPEWPTVFLAITIYAGWAVATWCHGWLPIWVLVPMGAWLIAWHGSLQHETIHGHPTSYPGVNALIGSLPLALWLPYRCYRHDHIAHHAAEMVTHPVEDPESRYLLSSQNRITAVRYAIARLEAPLLGRLLLGPVIAIIRFLAGEFRRAVYTPRAVLRDWIPHLIGVAIVLAWLHVCRMDLGLYLATFVYPGTALSLLRSFAEHRAATEPGHRVAVVEDAGPFALLFLHNNLHAAHHRAPGLPWFRLPAFYRRYRREILRDNGGLLYRGYGEIVRRFAFRPHDTLTHPVHR